jgi:hypothetical protein
MQDVACSVLIIFAFPLLYLLILSFDYCPDVDSLRTSRANGNGTSYLKNIGRSLLLSSHTKRVVRLEECTTNSYGSSYTVSGFSDSGVVAETSAVEVDGFGVVLARSASCHAIRPGQIRHDIRRRRRQHRRRSSSARLYVIASFNCRQETARRYFLMFMTGDWTILLFFSSFLF